MDPAMESNVTSPSPELSASASPQAPDVRQRRPKVSERTAIAIRDDVMRVTRAQPKYWVSVHEIAQRLGLDDDVVDAAVQSAIEHGWFVGDGHPPHSVRLAMTSLQEPS
jgi:hypothetical protein